MHLTLLAVLPALSFLPGIGGDPVPVRRTFQLEASRELTEFQVWMGGAEVPSEYLPDMDLAIDTSRRLVVLDTPGDGGLTRLYEEANRSGDSSFFMPPSTEQDDEGRATSALEGLAVHFGADGAPTWSEDSASAGNPALLEGLVRDLSLAEFAPPAEGESSWEIDGSRLAFLFEPGGDLSWQWTATEGFHVPDMMPEAPRGSLEVQLAPEAEGSGALLVEGELVTRAVEATDLEKVPVASGTATNVVETTYDVRGTARLDPESGRVVAVDLTATLTETLDTTKDAGQPGPDYRSLMTFEGTWSFEARAETP